MDDAKKKAEEQNDKEYDDAFEAIAKGEEPKDEAAPAEKPPAAKEEEQQPEAPEAPEKKDDKEPSPPAEDEAEGDKAEPNPAEAQPKGEAKALRDTKAWATKLAQENAELKKKMAQYEAGNASAKEVQDAKDALKETKAQLSGKLAKVYEDYPELKEVLDPMLTMAESLDKKIEDLKKTSTEERRRSEMKAYFEAEVEPKIVKAHPDFAAIKADDEYYQWADKQRPGLRTAALNSMDPDDIIMAVTEFKKFKNSPEAASKKADDDTRKNAVKENLSSIRGGSSDKGKRKPSSLDEVDKNDYDSAFDMAAKSASKS